MDRQNACRALIIGLLLLGSSLPGCASRPEVNVPVGWTPLPLDRPTPTPASDSSTLVPQPASVCENDARFLDDLSFPDGEIVVPGQNLDKRWSMLNSGTCDWGTGYRLIRLGEDDFEGPEAVALYPARVGTNAVWQIDLRAPMETGTYVSQWQAQAPDGSTFGEVVYILITVEQPTPTPTATPLVSPTPE